MVTLVTDRTQQDVINKTEKGYYNASDLNRVNEAVTYIANAITSAGYSVSVSVPAKEWTDSDIPTPTQMQEYLTNVDAIKKAVAVLKTTPETPGNMRFLTYQTANDIERILFDVDIILTSMSAIYIRAGMPWALANVGIYAAN